MGFKNFRINIISRVILLWISMFAFVFAIYQDKWYVTTTTFFIISLALLIDLIRYAEKTRKELGQWIMSIQLRDFNPVHTGASSKTGKGPDQLKLAFEGIIREFRNITLEKEIHYQYILTLIEHIEIALICISDNGDIELVNREAKKLLNLAYLKNISQLNQLHPELGQILQQIRAGEHKIFKHKTKNQLMQLSVGCTEFKLNPPDHQQQETNIKGAPKETPEYPGPEPPSGLLQATHHKLVSFHDIKAELEAQELESWQKLIRVLTHEIMNSVTPISSLSAAINENLVDDEGQRIPVTQLASDDLDDMYRSIKTIEHRSQGLLKFVNTYKSITRLPQPQFESYDIEKLIRHVSALMKPVLDKRGIILKINSTRNIPPVYLDHEMISRVLINLVLNAAEAMDHKDDPLIIISISRDAYNRTLIEVIDNGCGIEQEVLDNIFVPFFTTKAEGSGIGLSLSRQIIQLHGGGIEVNSRPGEGTRVKVRL